MPTIPFSTREDLIAWLDTLPPADRVATCRMLGDTHTTGALAALADATVYAATRTGRAERVAADLDLTVQQVNRAVRNHNARARAAAAR